MAKKVESLMDGFKAKTFELKGCGEIFNMDVGLMVSETVSKALGGVPIEVKANVTANDMASSGLDVSLGNDLNETLDSGTAQRGIGS